MSTMDPIQVFRIEAAELLEQIETGLLDLLHDLHDKGQIDAAGGKPRLGSISKMGNRHLRKLLVVGAHAALYRMKKGTSDTPLANWARGLLAKKPFKLVAVALANKIARAAWAIMARNTEFQPDFTSGNSAMVSASA